jgi:Phosphoenolpyruvate phosphomutase
MRLDVCYCPMRGTRPAHEFSKRRDFLRSAQPAPVSRTPKAIKTPNASTVTQWSARSRNHGRSIDSGHRRHRGWIRSERARCRRDGRCRPDAGAVGVNLEDANHYGGADPLLSVNQQCERIAAAREIANGRGVSLVINARTDTFLLQLGTDIEERVAITVDRGTRYLRAGADLVFVPLLVDTSVLARLVSRMRGPISVMALPGAPSANDLFAAGVVRVSIGQLAMLAALGTLKNIALELIQHGTWRSIEASFYGFSEADALFAPRSLEVRPVRAGPV